MSQKTILLTGATGFIGSHLLPKLLEKKYQVIILKKSSSPIWRIKKLLPQVKSYNLDQISLRLPFQENKIDCLIHLAAKYVKRDQNYGQIEKMVDTNLKIPSLLCHLCLRHKVKYFINTGTFFEYQTSSKPLTENSPFKSYNFYAATKTAFSQILKQHTEELGFKAIDFKLASVFGPKDNPKLLNFLIKSLIRGQKIDFSPGDQRWNFTYVEDTIQAYLNTIQHLPKLSSYETLNIGYNKPHSIKDIVKNLEKISGKKLNITWGAKPYPENEIMFANYDHSKAKKLINWKPSYNLYTGLEKTYNYYQKHPKKL